MINYEMFQEATSSGKHLICDFKNINSSLLRDKYALIALCKEICEENNFIIEGEVEKEFSPEGISFLFLLSESHLSIHTFPERNHISFDLYTCRQYDDNNAYINIYESMVERLNASNSVYKIIDRYF